MTRQAIPLSHLALPVVHTFDDAWMLLCAGANKPGGYNVMTISWGGLGVIWNKPLAMVVVRPSRYTYAFMEQGDSFTLSVFPGEFKDRLTLCGTRSGRNLDKVKACGFTPVPSTLVQPPGFDEAELILECSKMYYDDIEPAHFLADHIRGNYGERDYHRMYFGEIVAAHGTSAYRRS
jgi:flavin reductase (DIM6/NTAB) family NADH-FMN oxidoreductase RutF